MSLACHKAQSFLPLDAETIYQACRLVPQVGRPAAILTDKTGTSPRGSIDNLVCYVLCISTAPGCQQPDAKKRSSDAGAFLHPALDRHAQEDL